MSSMLPACSGHPTGMLRATAFGKPRGRRRHRRRSAQKRQPLVVCERRLISSSIPPICGSKANKMRSMAKFSGAGRILPPDIHATSLIAASVWGSAACPTLVIAASRSWRRSATKASRSRQNIPTPRCLRALRMTKSDRRMNATKKHLIDSPRIWADYPATGG
jgi:hypothetical protein